MGITSVLTEGGLPELMKLHPVRIMTRENPKTSLHRWGADHRPPPLTDSELRPTKYVGLRPTKYVGLRLPFREARGELIFIDEDN